MKKINFILPATDNTPIGGYKIVYQYANELCKRGFDVTINFLYHVRPQLTHMNLQKLKRWKRKTFHDQLPAEKVTWFNLNKKVHLNYNVIDLDEVSDGDIVIATSAPTAAFVAALSETKGKKYYFIQNYETWWYESVAQLNATYNLGLVNIVISHDLFNKVKKATGKEPQYLPNFYDDSEFYVTESIEKRNNTVALLNHIQSSKRTKFGLDILAEVHRQIPNLHVELFGAYPPIQSLPDYVHFTYKATPKQLRESIYGVAKVYLLPSVLEGWGLTGTEAMACGTALVASMTGGIEEYAKADNSILVSPNDKEEFIQAVVELLLNDRKRKLIIENGLGSVKRFTLEKSTERFLNILMK